MKQLDFKIGDWVVHPAHGVGNITAIEKLCIDNTTLEYYVIVWTGKGAWKVMVPVGNAIPLGLRLLAPPAVVAETLRTVHKKPGNKKTRWEHQKRVYTQKVNSGDLISIAEVVRDLRVESEGRPLDEINLLETAIGRLAREIALIEGVSEVDVKERIMIEGGTTGGTTPPSPKPTTPKTRRRPSKKVTPSRPKNSQEILDTIWSPPADSTKGQSVTSPTITAASPRKRVSKHRAYFGGVLMTQDQIPGGTELVIKDGQWVPR